MGALVKSFKIRLNAPRVSASTGRNTTVVSDDSRKIYMKNGGILTVAVVQEGPRQLDVTYVIRTTLRHLQPGVCCCFMQVMNHETGYSRARDYITAETILAPFPEGADFTWFHYKVSAKGCELSGGRDDSECLILDVSVILRDTHEEQLVVEEQTFLVNVSKNPGRALRSDTRYPDHVQISP